MTTDPKPRTRKPATLGACIDKCRAIESQAATDREKAVKKAAERAAARFDRRLAERQWEFVNQLPDSDRATAISVLRLKPLADGVPTSGEAPIIDGEYPEVGEDDGPVGASLGGTADEPAASHDGELPAWATKPVDPLPPGSIVDPDARKAATNERRTGARR